jgi:transcriptional regulator with GAF, ATPase, and Fis domain
MSMPTAIPTPIDDWSPNPSSRQTKRSLEPDVTPERAKPQPTLVGNSPAMQKVFSIIERVAPTDASVLITGATGTGKELAARAIHERSPRRNAAFVDINCSAIPETLIEAELFGHQRGTFTGAHENRSGLFEKASGGTLFLDEVDALNLAAQAKLLRVLQERTVRRIGARANIAISLRRLPPDVFVLTSTTGYAYCLCTCPNFVLVVMMFACWLIIFCGSKRKETARVSVASPRRR